MIEFDCPQCHHHITAADQEAGIADICPKCNSPVTIPGAPAAVALPAPTANQGSQGTGSPAPVERVPCPICGAMIAAQAKKCRFCGKMLETAPAPVDSDGKNVPESDEEETDEDEYMPIPERLKTVSYYLADARSCDVNFEGRATRREYWWVMPIFCVLNLVTFFIASFVAALLFDPEVAAAKESGSPGGRPGARQGGGSSVKYAPLLLLLAFFALIGKTMALAWRRCHDANKPGAIGVSVALLPPIAVAFVASACFVHKDPVAFLAGPGRLVIEALGALFLIGVIVIGLFPGVKGENQYGPDPYDEDFEDD